MTAPALLFLPGLLCDAEVWAAQTAALGRDRRCLVAEYGLADALTTMAERALQLADAAGLDRLAVVGHSMGGRVAAELWHLAPQRVAGLALMDTGWHPLPGGEAGQAERAGRQRLLDIARRQGMSAMARDWVQGMVHPDRLDTPLAEAVVAMLARRTPDHQAAQIHALLHRPDASATLRTVTVPTLLLTGAQDAWSPPARHDEMAAMVAGPVSRVDVPHCGHMAPMEAPQAVTAALAAWLTTL
ncbi:alpha/beta fold hydrolase [Ideonella sp. 4Y11]|uniref:Alpha/beta fold hydrolase n=1 Tax=Ideonella aquatica TaxID=2824119 RepID=A0A940YE19_9BURK|nr:alpha/beta hydrolase [Ideonella aquatica]MBQ0958488.1 alpha/beta fold hydrolase [Ideonella aquatica]